MTIVQGEIFWADLSPALGNEQNVRRPALVLSRDSLNQLPLTILGMIGTGAEHLEPTRRYPTDLRVTAAESGLPKDTVFMGLQIRSIDPRRLQQRIGILPRDRLIEAMDIVRSVMGDPRPL
jgi:mRNA interferase MazF